MDSTENTQKYPFPLWIDFNTDNTIIKYFVVYFVKNKSKKEKNGSILLATSKD